MTRCGEIRAVAVKATVSCTMVAVAYVALASGLSHGARAEAAIERVSDIDRFMLMSDDGSTFVGTQNPFGGLGVGDVWIWDEEFGRRVVMPPPGTDQWLPSDVSPDGSVVVGWKSDRLTAGTDVPVIWSLDGGIVEISVPLDRCEGSALGASADGSVVVGWLRAGCGGGTNGDDYWEGFVWTAANGFELLGGLPGFSIRSWASDVSDDGMIVVGHMQLEEGLRAARWTTTGLELLSATSSDETPDVSWARAEAMTPDGSVVFGIAGDALSPLAQLAFVWDAENGIRYFGPRLSDQCAVADASSDGQLVVGTCWPACCHGDPGIGFVWDARSVADPGEGLVELGAYLESIGVDLAGWTQLRAIGISSDGGILAGLGTAPGSDGGQNDAWRLVVPVPEASSGLASLASLLTSAVVARVRRTLFLG